MRGADTGFACGILNPSACHLLPPQISEARDIMTSREHGRAFILLVPLSNAAKKKTGAKARVSVGWCSGLAQRPPVGTGQCFVKAMAQIGPAIINFNQCQRNQSDTRFSFPSAAATR